ncbi:hypothetical protein N9L68_02735 [bacterium]|nr:hypothetical protein [bacterium]
MSRVLAPDIEYMEYMVLRPDMDYFAIFCIPHMEYEAKHAAALGRADHDGNRFLANTVTNSQMLRGYNASVSIATNIRGRLESRPGALHGAARRARSVPIAHEIDTERLRALPGPLRAFPGPLRALPGPLQALPGPAPLALEARQLAIPARNLDRPRQPYNTNQTQAIAKRLTVMPHSRNRSRSPRLGGLNLGGDDQQQQMARTLAMRADRGRGPGGARKRQKKDDNNDEETRRRPTLRPTSDDLMWAKIYGWILYFMMFRHLLLEMGACLCRVCWYISDRAYHWPDCVRACAGVCLGCFRNIVAANHAPAVRTDDGEDMFGHHYASHPWTTRAECPWTSCRRLPVLPDAAMPPADAPDAVMAEAMRPVRIMVDGVC